MRLWVAWMLMDLQLLRLTSPWPRQLRLARGFSALYQAAPVLMAPVPEGGLRQALSGRMLMPTLEARWQVVSPHAGFKIAICNNVWCVD